MLVNRLIPALLATPILCSDGFYKLDFDVRKGFNLTEVVDNFFKGIGDAIDDTLDGVGDLLDKRDNGSQQVPLTNERAFYITTLKIGSDSSEVKVLLDTGSADLWVMSSKNSYCTENGGSMNCDQYGTYNEDNSTTFNKNDTEFSIQYLDQTFAKGTWGQDTIELTSSLILKEGNLAVADETDSNVGVFGIGYKSLESAQDKYDNIPIQMKQQGFIEKVCYSLYLTPAESEKGSILFGGVDHAKYTGELVKFDIVPINGVVRHFQIPLNDLTVNLITPVQSATTTATTLVSSPSPHPTIALIDDTINQLFGNNKRDDNVIALNTDGLFDSGTTLTYLPQAAVDSLISKIAPGASYNSNLGGYQVPCSLRQEGNSVSYNFDNKKSIEVPLSDLVMIAGRDSMNQQQCMLGVVANDDHTILGDNFLRSCYTLFDLEDNTVSIAQMKYSDDEDIEVIH